MSKKFLIINCLLVFVACEIALGTSCEWSYRRVIIAYERSEGTRWQSMTVRNAVWQIIDQIPEQIEIAIYEFSSCPVQVVHAPSFSHQQASAIRNRIPSVGLRDPFINYDTLLAELGRWKTWPCLVVLLTRGESNPSQGHPFVDILPSLLQVFSPSEGHELFVVGLHDRLATRYECLAYGQTMTFHRLDPRVPRPVFFPNHLLTFKILSATATPLPTPSPTVVLIPTLTPTEKHTKTQRNTPTTRPTPTPIVAEIVIKPTPSATPLRILVDSNPSDAPATLTTFDYRSPSLWDKIYWNDVAILAGFGIPILIVIWALLARRNTSRPDLARVDPLERVFDFTLTDPEGKEIILQTVRLGEGVEKFSVGNSPKDSLFLPELAGRIRMWLIADGRLLTGLRFWRKEVLPGNPISLGGGYLLLWSSDLREILES